MKKLFFTSLLALAGIQSFEQTIAQKISAAWQAFESDSQLKQAIASLYIEDAGSGTVVFGKNQFIGLAPASTQKIITSASAYELLGKNFRYETQFGIDKTDGNTILTIYPSGDPTLGSWRWKETTERAVIQRLVANVKKAGITAIDVVSLNESPWNSETIPDGWIWQDIGNYYGAGAAALNWRENQYDIRLRSGKNIGDKVQIQTTNPEIYDLKLESRLRSAAKGTGDNAWVYYPLNQNLGLLRGTIPVEESGFTISAAMPNSANQFLSTIADSLRSSNISMPKKPGEAYIWKNHTRDISIIHKEFSPVLDSIIFWFNKRSINLYGEALIKTFAFVKKGEASTEEGVKRVKDLWKERGILKTELNMVDGSGLSPLNRVTTHAQVTVLRYAKKQDWFNGFYFSLPEYNGMKMKSGTINGAKGFCGFHRSKEGKEYIFSFLVNNYNGSSSALVQKMYKVLDLLK